MLCYQIAMSSGTSQESLKVIETDVQHASMLAASIPRNKIGERLQLELVHNQFAPLILYLLQWIDCSCTPLLLPSCLDLFYMVVYKVNKDCRADKPSHRRRATMREFYAIILPYLQHLYENFSELVNDAIASCSSSSKSGFEKSLIKFSEIDFEREHECGICLEPCTKMVLPNCCHLMCINCYRDRNLRSESCPFFRGNIKIVQSGDLWVLTCGTDVVNPKTVMKEDILRLYLYINTLPKEVPDASFLMYYEYLI